MKDNLKNLFVIGTPLQLLNAIEAIAHFKLNNNVLVLLNMSKIENKKQIDKIVKQHDWQTIIRVDNGKGLNFFKYFSLIRGLKKKKYNYVFVAKLESISCAIVANVQKNKFFLLDDGGKTLDVYNTYKKNNYSVKHQFKDNKFLLLGLKIQIKDKVNFFTYYDLKSEDGSEVIKNKFEFFKKSYSSDYEKENKLLYFFGQPIIGNYLSEELHRDILKAIIKKYNKKLIYVPHRGEDKDSLEHLKLINSEFFEVKNLEMPAELYFIINKIHPKELFSYFSTVLTTMGLIYENCEAYYVELIKDKYNEKCFPNNDFIEFYNNLENAKVLKYEDLGIIK